MLVQFIRFVYRCSNTDGQKVSVRYSMSFYRHYKAIQRQKTCAMLHLKHIIVTNDYSEYLNMIDGLFAMLSDHLSESKVSK